MRLPGKLLLRFKCISRLWHFIISAPEFAKAQLRMSLQGNPDRSDKLLVFADFRDHNLDESIFTPMKSQGHLSFQGSCHGLVCLRGTGCRELFVYNPTTRELRQLSKSDSLRDPCLTRNAELICGFGYDTLKDDYKLVVRWMYPSKQTTMVEIYSLKSNSWRSITGVDHYNIQGHGRYSNGFVHWLSRKSEGYTIVSFNVATEEFCEDLPMPSFRLEGGLVQMSVTGGGTLVVYTTKLPRIEVWIMKDRGLNSTWTELCCFSNELLMKEQPWIQDDCISRLAEDGKTLLCVRQRHPYPSVHIYDPTDGSQKAFQHPNSVYEIITYVECLVSVSGC